MATNTFIMPTIFLAFLVSSASAYRSSTTRDDQSSSSCRDQIQEQQLSSCQQFLTHGSRYIVLQTRLGIDRPEQHLQECCSQLKQVDEQCRCKGLRHIVREQAEKGELPRKEMQKIVMRAENLLETCNLGTGLCRITRGGMH